jgi:sigma-70-like protein
MSEVDKPLTRDQIRSRRRHPVASQTLSRRHISKRDLEIGRALFPPEEDADRPRLRSECESAARPCPFVSCKHHLYLDVTRDTGAIKFNFPDLEVWDMRESCVLDVAGRDGETLEVVGEYMNLTRERIRQIEHRALKKVRRAVRLGKRLLPLVDDRP